MKLTIVIAFFAMLLAASPATAGIKLFHFAFSGIGNGNDVKATGSISLEMDLVNPGLNFLDRTETGPGTGIYFNDYGASTPGLVTALTITVSGSSDPTANGTFHLENFDAVLFDIGAGVDLNQELVGQTSYLDSLTGAQTWGSNYVIYGSSTVRSYTGDFQLFSPADSPAPFGFSSPFQLMTGGLEAMNLTSFGAPEVVPEPSTSVLLVIALGAVGYARKKLLKREK